MLIIEPTGDDYTAATEPYEPSVRPTLLPWAQWNALRDAWPRDARLGVLLPNTVDVELLRAELPRWSLIALQFPKWTDGRAYSQARLLRARLGYGGEIRATGDVLVDMMPLLERSGFSTVQLRADQNADAARRALGLFAGHYQGDVLEPRPRFARQAA